jgi:uncharacterized protein (TIGR02391 family)
VIDLPEDVVLTLPVDELGLAILDDMIASGTWNEYNYLLEAARTYSDEVSRCIAEAVAWLRARAFIARPPHNSSDSAIFVTRTGQKVAEEGRQTFNVLERLQVGLHPLIDRKVRRQFLIGEYEQGVFVAMKAVEMRIRSVGGFPDDLVGLDLLKEAFKPGIGRFADPALPVAEQEGSWALFRGAYAVLRNPAGHRDVNYEDVTEAAEAVALASMLLRVLDRVEHRLPAAPN